MVGRARELATTRGLLLSDELRLLTLVGPAGIGTTRLAQALAVDVLDAFPDGAWFIDLAPLTDPVLALSATANTLGIGGEEAAADAAARTRDAILPLLTRRLRDRRLLLVPDNFEQVLPAASSVVELLAACPGGTMLVTSRERLRLRVEHVFPVPPLSLPDLDRRPGLEALAKVPAVALFLQRARAIKPGVVLTADNAVAIAELCVRLDGLPLAIELAAVHSNLLTPAAMLAYLGPRLPLLNRAARDMPARHQTLRVAIDWSHDLLADEERALFRRLWVFAGGFTLEAAEAVGGRNEERPRPTPGPHSPSSALCPPTPVLDLVASLVDKSLLRQTAEATGPELRFGMLETIRGYALEQLRASGELDATQRRHAAYFLSWPNGRRRS